MVFSMNENVLHEKQNVINENIETEGVVCRLVHQKFCCVLAEGAALETLWEKARAQAEPCSLALVLHATALGLFSFCIQRKRSQFHNNIGVAILSLPLLAY